ncbi:hypothetical protein SAMN04488005_3223 [Yoonia tamlensis]|uniref:Uncharacterized protein n=1 Tax=Yoonia tamlensis TaxID=390270 RepID=A0A1I6I1T0_9RHOB|nr:hypothetical protein [Yoonia tamlensis]SFR60655.1 hypothetical protein SAMN04488005_3223 [Yoonia tamlensis]
MVELFYKYWIALGVTIGAIVVIYGNFRSLGAMISELRDWLIVKISPEDFDTGWPQALSARYCNERWEIDEVLRLRRQYFEEVLKGDVISSDDSYWDAFEKNPYAFRIVSELEQPFGYWGIIPVSKESFDQFLLGDLSHAEMLSEACISWADADPANLYLYHIGVVTIPKSIDGGSSNSLPIREAKVELDNIATIYELSKWATIKGVAVYASTAKGEKAIIKNLLALGFERTGKFAASDRLSEIAVLRGDAVAGFFDAIYKHRILRLLARHKGGRVAGAWTWLSNIIWGPDYVKRVPDADRRELVRVRSELRKRPPVKD